MTPLCPIRDGSKRFNLFSLFLFFLLKAFERRSASISSSSSSKGFLLREDIIAALLRPRWVERSGLFLLLQSRKEKERNESSLSSAKGKEESWFWAKTRRRRKGFLPPKRRKMRHTYFTNTIFQTLSLSLSHIYYSKTERRGTSSSRGRARTRGRSIVWRYCG